MEEKWEKGDTTGKSESVILPDGKFQTGKTTFRELTFVILHDTLNLYFECTWWRFAAEAARFESGKTDIWRHRGSQLRALGDKGLLAAKMIRRCFFVAALRQRLRTDQGTAYLERV